MGRLKEADEAVRQIQHILAARPNAGASTMVVHLNQMDYQEWDRFRKKEELHAAIGNYRRARGEGAFPFYPASFSMPEDEATLRQAAVERGGEAIWIVKPTYLFGGQGMRLVQGLNDVPREAGHIVQAYIDRPYLVQGKKSHIRLYLLITSVEPLRAYLWRNGIVRFAPEPYRPAPGWLDRTAIHITNTALHKGHPDLVLSDDPARDDYGNVWSLTALLRHIEAQGIDAETLWPRLESLVLAFARVVEHSGLFRRQAEQPGREAYPPKLVGLDVLLDAELRPWLLEAQRTPGQTGSVIVESVNAALFRTIAAMSAFTLLDAERPDPGGPSDIKDRSARERLESEIEYARRGDFVRLIPPDPAASEASSTQVGL